MENSQQQIAIIVWKWRHLPHHINQKILKEIYGGAMPNLDNGINNFYSEFEVEGSRICPNARLIAISIYNDGDHTQILLDRILEKYLPEEITASPSKVMLFLHRGNDYSEKDVSQFLEKYPNRLFKVFLFSDKRDYLYYPTRNEGLLDDIGSFAWGKDERTGEKFSVLDRSSKKIKQPYFDRIWQYYSNEFESKVFSLKEDLFEQWFPFLISKESPEIRRIDSIECIQKPENQLLWYRLKSFIGVYDDVLEKNPNNFDIQNQRDFEIEQLMDAERNQGQSLLFDDCIENLKQQEMVGLKLISDGYKDVTKALNNTIFNEDREFISIVELQEIGDKFNELVKVIPGLMD